MEGPRSAEITTWHLEQADPRDLIPARKVPVEVIRAKVPSPELSRFLTRAVFGDLYWLDRLTWSYADWEEWLRRPGFETWIARNSGTPAGYIELRPGPGGQVKISSFGVLPAFAGLGIGGHLLTVGTARAWDLADRWPVREPTQRVWLHTSSLDGKAALSNYLARGFRIYDTRVETELIPTVLPGPWPGASRRDRPKPQHHPVTVTTRADDKTHAPQKSHR